MLASPPSPSGLCRILPSPPRSPKIAAVTRPLDVLVDRDVLVLGDDENLRYGARDLGYQLCMRRLRRCIERYACRCELHAFFSRKPGDQRRCHYLRECGWTPHPRDIETVQTHRGMERLANSDNDLLFAAGILATRSKADVIVLASGDGTLVCDLARNLCQLCRACTIVTLSLPGSTSCRLDASRNPHIHANIEIGLDCLHRHARL